MDSKANYDVMYWCALSLVFYDSMKIDLRCDILDESKILQTDWFLLYLDLLNIFYELKYYSKRSKSLEEYIVEMKLSF